MAKPPEENTTPATDWDVRKAVSNLALDEFYKLCDRFGCNVGDNNAASMSCMRVIEYLKNKERESEV